MAEEDEIDRILRRYGEKSVLETERFLTNKIENVELLEPIRYMLGIRRDYLHPALVSLSCMATRGQTIGVPSLSMAISLACHSMAVFDDLIDRTNTKNLIQTLPKKFGVNRALLVAALAAAKAFYALSTLNQKIATETYTNINTVFQDFLVKMAVAEVQNSNLAEESILHPESRLKLLDCEGVDIETSARLGVMVGGSSLQDIECLAEYGRYLGRGVRLREDFECSLNLTLELEDKIRRGAFPYPLAWALTHADNSRDLLAEFALTEHKKEYITKLIALLFDTGAVSHIEYLVHEASQNATSALSKMRNGKAKDSLTRISLAQEKLLLKSIKLGV